MYRFEREYARHLDVVCFTDMHASDCALSVRNRQIVLSDTDVGEWVERWLHCGECSVSVSHCRGSDDTKVLNMKSVCRNLYSVLMGSRYPSSDRPLSPCAVQGFICILPSALVTISAIATLGFICVVMHREYLLTAVMSSCSQPHHRM